MLKKVMFLVAAFMLMANGILADEYVAKGDPVALTMDGEYYLAPEWSPAGEQIAAAGPSFNHIYIIEFPTGQSFQLTDAISAGHGFSWSHDGSRIAARTAHYDGSWRKHALVSFDVASGAKETFISPESRISGKPRWSMDDNQLYLTFSDKFEAVSAQGQRSSNPDAAPVVVEDGKLMTREAGAQSHRMITEDQDRVTSYEISPDGQYIVYSTSGQNLWISDISGNNRLSLGKGITPSWAPDSEWFSYMITEDDGHEMLSAEIFIMNRNGSGKTNITNTSDRLEMRPKWSPDGSWIVYDTENLGQLFIQQIEWR